MIGARPLAAMFATVLAVCAASALAQQLYRWTDEKGRVHITDTPPPPSAKQVQKQGLATAPATPQQTPFELQAMKDFPVTLYTSPNCEEPCTRAREVLNQRGVPFREVQVWEKDTVQELTRIAGSASQVPVLVVGQSVHKGFQQSAFNALLDSAHYPRAGLLPPRAQAAPKPPADYGQTTAKPVEAEKPVEDPKPTGPYAPRFSK